MAKQVLRHRIQKHKFSSRCLAKNWIPASAGMSGTEDHCAQPLSSSCAANARRGAARWRKSAQLVQQRLRTLEDGRVEAFRKPAIDRSEKIACLITLTPIAPQPRHAHRRAQL